MTVMEQSWMSSLSKIKSEIFRNGLFISYRRDAHLERQRYKDNALLIRRFACSTILDKQAFYEP